MSIQLVELTLCKIRTGDLKFEWTTSLTSFTQHNVCHWLDKSDYKSLHKSVKGKSVTFTFCLVQRGVVVKLSFTKLCSSITKHKVPSVLLCLQCKQVSLGHNAKKPNVKQVKCSYGKVTRTVVFLKFFLRYIYIDSCHLKSLNFSYMVCPIPKAV